MVYEGVRDVRRAVLQMRDPDTWDDSDVEHSQVSQDSEPFFLNFKPTEILMRA